MMQPPPSTWCKKSTKYCFHQQLIYLAEEAKKILDCSPLAALAVLPSGLLEAPLTPALLFSGCSLVLVVDSFPVEVFASLVCLDVAVVREEVRVTLEDELGPVTGGLGAFDKPGIQKREGQFLFKDAGDQRGAQILNVLPRLSSLSIMS